MKAQFELELARYVSAFNKSPNPGSDLAAIMIEGICETRFPELKLKAKPVNESVHVFYEGDKLTQATIDYWKLEADQLEALVKVLEKYPNDDAAAEKELIEKGFERIAQAFYHGSLYRFVDELPEKTS